MVRDPGAVDLHAHTVFSDGLFSPGQLVVEAKKRGLAAVGVTDHDTVDGVEAALDAGRRYGVEIVPGAELSCFVHGVDVHVLGYYLGHRDRAVLDFFREMKAAREQRAGQMVERLVDLGVDVSMEQVKKIARSAAVGRPHVAQAMVESGAVVSLDQAFRRYIGYDGPAYVPKFKLSPERAVDFIKSHGGVAVVAHPGTYRRDEATYATIAAGVDGLEVWHPDHGEREVLHFSEMAQKNRLVMTGGSDCHGGRKGNHVYLGEVRVPYRYLAAVKRLHRERKS